MSEKYNLLTSLKTTEKTKSEIFERIYYSKADKELGFSFQNE